MTKSILKPKVVTINEDEESNSESSQYETESESVPDCLSPHGPNVNFPTSDEEDIPDPKLARKEQIKLERVARMNEARRVKDIKYNERQIELEELKELKLSQAKIKMEKTITNKINRKLSQEQRMNDIRAEKERIKKEMNNQSEYSYYSDDAIQPVHTQSRQSKTPRRPVVMDYNAYMKHMGF
jgi:hypothetical protein